MKNKPCAYENFSEIKRTFPSATFIHDKSKNLLLVLLKKEILIYEWNRRIDVVLP